MTGQAGLAGGTSRRGGPLARMAVRILRLYQEAISPLRPPACRYQPTCSSYAVEAVETHGLVRGAWLALRRLLRCHPLHTGGHDPVPAARPTRPTARPAA